MIMDKNDKKFAEAVDKALTNGWQIVNVVWHKFGDPHIAYLTRK